jgi:hypothetical protein
MASVQEIRQRLRGQRIEALRSSIKPLLAGRAGAEVWLFGSLARGDWDARSDGDPLAGASAGRQSLVAGHLPRCDPSPANPEPMTGLLHAWLRQAHGDLAMGWGAGPGGQGGCDARELTGYASL